MLVRAATMASSCVCRGKGTRVTGIIHEYRERERDKERQKDRETEIRQTERERDGEKGRPERREVFGVKHMHTLVHVTS